MQVTASNEFATLITPLRVAWVRILWMAAMITPFVILVLITLQCTERLMAVARIQLLQNICRFREKKRIRKWTPLSCNYTDANMIFIFSPSDDIIVTVGNYRHKVFQFTSFCASCFWSTRHTIREWVHILCVCGGGGMVLEVYKSSAWNALLKSPPTHQKTSCVFLYTSGSS